MIKTQRADGEGERKGGRGRDQKVFTYGGFREKTEVGREKVDVCMDGRTDRCISN